MKNQAGVKLEDQAVIFWFRWDSWAAATFGPRTRAATRTATNLWFNSVDQNEIFTMTGKSPSRHWKTIHWKSSGQLKTLEKEKADLLKLFSGHLTKLEGYLTQKKTMTAESAYRCFFETYDNLEVNRKQQKLILKPKYLEAFDNDTKRMLEEKSKVLRWELTKYYFSETLKVSPQNSSVLVSTQIRDNCLPNLEWTIRFGEEVENRKLKQFRKTDIV